MERFKKFYYSSLFAAIMVLVSFAIICIYLVDWSLNGVADYNIVTWSIALSIWLYGFFLSIDVDIMEQDYKNYQNSIDL